MRKQIKCKHYNGDGYTYPISNGDISLCIKCEKKLREEMAKQQMLEAELILPIKENKNGQKRVTIPKDSMKDTKYVKVKKYG